MQATAVVCVVSVSILSVAGCSHSTSVVAAETERPAITANVGPERNIIRSTGLIQALEWQSVRVPQISSGMGAGGRVTLTKLIPNGRKVSKGDLLVEFDRTAILDEERDAKAKIEDFSHQLEEKKALVKTDSAKRFAQIKEAQADLDKSEIQLRKGEVLSEIDRLKNGKKAVNARLRVASLKKSDEHHRKSDEAAVKILELKTTRLQVALERIQTNLKRLQILAPQDGMVALENTWRNGSMGPSQEGDQVWPGLPILRIFNPSKMVVSTTINEPDIPSVKKDTRARLYLDAYPNAVFDARLESASPVATAGMDSPVRTFTAVFRIEQQNPLLLPDLSAALEIERQGRGK